MFEPTSTSWQGLYGAQTPTHKVFEGFWKTRARFFFRGSINLLLTEAKAFLISSYEMNDPLASPLVADQEMGEAPSGRLDISKGEDL